MAFQFNIYPTGAVTNYVNKVSDPLGVSAIIDRGMGITEHSMSGVAFYIKAIEDFINTTNVGKLSTADASGIVSGFFQHLGYSAYGDSTKDVFHVSTSGVISGVNQIWTKDINAYTNDVYIQTVTAYSGILYNTILDNSVLADEGGSYFTSLDLASGYIKNYYSGYAKGYDASTEVIPVSGGEISLSNPRTYAYQINEYRCILNDIIFRKAPRGYIIPGDVVSYHPEYGIKEGRFLGRDFSLTSDQNFFVSGNFYIGGAFTLNIANIGQASTFAEHILDFDYHTHDGIDSRYVSASGVNANRPTTGSLSVVMQSGDLTAGGFFIGNNFGLSSSWEEVETFGVDNPQRLETFGDSLMIIGKNKVVEFGSDKQPLTIDPGCIIAGYAPMPSENTGGDLFTIFNFDKQYHAGGGNDNNYIIDGHLTMKFWDPTGKKHGETIRTFLDPTHTISTTDYGDAENRRIHHLDTFHRVNGRVYFSLWERRSAAHVNISSYEINPNTYDVRLVGTAGDNGGIIDEYIIPNTPFSLSNNFVITTRYVATDVVANNETSDFIYNSVYQFPVDWTGLSAIERDFFTWFTPAENLFVLDEFWNQVTGGTRNYDRRYISDYTYLDGNMFYMFSHQICRVRIGNVNMPLYEDANISGNVSLLAYGGRLHTGQCLEWSFTMDGNKYIDSESSDNVKEIIGVSDPWLWSPVVHGGYVYAIAPKVNYSAWYEDDFSSETSIGTTNPIRKQNVHYRIPNGAKLVRKKIGENYLTDGMSAYNT